MAQIAHQLEAPTKPCRTLCMAGKYYFPLQSKRLAKSLKNAVLPHILAKIAISQLFAVRPTYSNESILGGGGGINGKAMGGAACWHMPSACGACGWE